MGQSGPVILFVDQFAELGGAQRVMLDLLPALEHRYTPIFALPGKGRFTDELEKRGICCEPLALGSYTPGRKPLSEILGYALRQPALIAGLARLAQKRRPALIYANGPRLFPASAAVARRLRVPLLWHLHLQVERASADRRLIQAAARVGRPAVVSCSHACLRPFPPGSFLRRNARVVYNGVRPAARLRSDPGVLPAEPVIGVVGRIHPDKGQADLLRAAPAILRAVSGARFRLIGPVQDKRYAAGLRRQAARLPDGSVEFRGAVDSPAGWVGLVDLLAVPSLREPSALVIPEAFSAGIPVVGSDAGGTPETIEPRRNGLLFPAGDADQLARAVIEVLRDGSLRQSLARGGWESYQQRWRLERFQREMLEQIAQQTAPRRPAR